MFKLCLVIKILLLYVFFFLLYSVIGISYPEIAKATIALGITEVQFNKK